MKGWLDHPNPRVAAQVAAQMGDSPAPKKKGRRKSTWSEDLAVRALIACGLPAPELEYHFHEERKWRFDMAWPPQMIALEIEGGIYTGGAHGSVAGALRDIEKYNAAGALGWTILRALPQWMPGDAGLQISAALVEQLQALFELKTR